MNDTQLLTALDLENILPGDKVTVYEAGQDPWRGIVTHVDSQSLVVAVRRNARGRTYRVGAPVRVEVRGRIEAAQPRPVYPYGHGRPVRFSSMHNGKPLVKRFAVLGMTCWTLYCNNDLELTFTYEHGIPPEDLLVIDARAVLPVSFDTRILNKVQDLIDFMIAHGASVYYPFDPTPLTPSEINPQEV